MPILFNPGKKKGIFMIPSGGTKSPTPPVPSFSSTKSLDFDGVDDYVDLGSPSTGTGTHTLSMWINPATITNDDRIISNLNNTNFSIRFTASNVEVWGNSWESVFTNPSTSTWTHICFMFDGSGNVTGYKDGVVGSTVATAYNLDNLGIGAKINLIHGGTFNGKIDEVSIFNSVKAIGDIWDGTGKPTDLSAESGLVAWYRMGENSTFYSQILMPENTNKDKVSNYSMAFDGTNDYISLSSVIPLGVLSVSFWMKSSDTATGSITNGLGNINFIGTSPLLRQSSNNYKYFADQVANFDGNWHHWFVLITGSGTSDISNARMFVDGVELAAGTIVTGGPPSAWTTADIGKGVYGYKAAILDEFAIWQSDETSNIATISASPLNDLTSLSPLVYLKMGEEAVFNSTNWLLPNKAQDVFSRYSMDFDGVNDYIDCGQNASILTNTFTVSCWVNAVSFGTWDTIIGCDKWNGVGNNGWILRVDGGGTEISFMNGATPGTLDKISFTISGNMNTGTWYQLVVVCDGAGNSELFLNGASMGTSTLTAAYDSNIKFIIGARNTNAGGLPPADYFQGKIDEVSVFNSVKAIGDLWDGSGKPTDLTGQSGIVSWWRMGEDATYDAVASEWTIPDQAGSNDGTSANMTNDDLTGDTPGVIGNGTSDNMTIEDRVGDAPDSENNSLSYNMDAADIVEEAP